MKTGRAFKLSSDFIVLLSITNDEDCYNLILIIKKDIVRKKKRVPKRVVSISLYGNES